MKYKHVNTCCTTNSITRDGKPHKNHCKTSKTVSIEDHAMDHPSKTTEIKNGGPHFIQIFGILFRRRDMEYPYSII